MRHGRGTYKFANGDVYDGEYKQDVREGRGTYTPAVEGANWIALSYYQNDVAVGDGVEWNNEKQRAFLLVNGKRTSQIDLKKALAIVAKFGLSVRNPPRPLVGK